MSRRKLKTRKKQDNPSVIPLKKGDTVCYKGQRNALAVVAKIADIDYGAGRVIRKAMIIWMTGRHIGTKGMFDLRDLVKVGTE